MTLFFTESAKIHFQRINFLFSESPAVSPLENADTMGERMGRIGQIKTDFLGMFHGKAKVGSELRYYGKTDFADLRIFADF